MEGDGACGGIITLIQRFGSSLNLNVHLHMLALDGVYANDQGKLRFQPLPAPAAALMSPARGSHSPGGR
jgi:hypothetical protein